PAHQSAELLLTRVIKRHEVRSREVSLEQQECRDEPLGHDFTSAPFPRRSAVAACFSVTCAVNREHQATVQCSRQSQEGLGDFGDTLGSRLSSWIFVVTGDIWACAPR